MVTLCTNLEYPHDGRRKAIIVTNNKKICEALAQDSNLKLKIIIEE